MDAKKPFGVAEVDGEDILSRVFKRLFGVVVSAERFERMAKEIELKVWVCNLMLGLAAAPAPLHGGARVDRRG